MAKILRKSNDTIYTIRFFESNKEDEYLWEQKTKNPIIPLFNSQVWICDELFVVDNVIYGFDKDKSRILIDVMVTNVGN